VRVWRLADGALQGEDRDYQDQVYGVDFAADGRLATTSYDGAVRLYDSDDPTLQRPHRQATQAGQRPFQIRFSPDGKHLAIGFEDKPAVEVRSASDLSLRAQPDVTELTGGALASVAWSIDSMTVLAAGNARRQGGSNPPVFGWPQRGSGPQQVAAPGFSSTVSALGALPGPGGRLAMASMDPAIGVFASGQHQALQLPPQTDYRAWLDSDDPARLLFRLSDDGSVVETDYQSSRGHPLRIDAGALTVSQLNAPTPGLISWEPAEGSLRVQQFNANPHPKLNGQDLGLYPTDVAYAVDVRHDRVFVGTLYNLWLFDPNARAVWPRPVPVPIAWRVAQSPDGRLVVAALGDGTVRWYRASDGAELLAFFLHADRKRWVAFTPSGYYAASPGGEDLVGWQVNNGADKAADFFPASRYRERFYRPDVVSLVLKTLDETAAVQQAQAARHEPAQPAPDAATLKQAVLEDRPPVVTILSPLPGTKLTSDAAELQVEVRSPTGRPITRVEARLNARPAPGAQIGEAQAMPATQGELAERRRILVPVAAGQTATVQVIAWSGERSSEAASVEVKGRAPAVEPQAIVVPSVRKPRLNAVLIGVSTYPDPNLKLKFAAKDAQDLAAALQKQKGGLYDDVNIPPPLVDSSATKQNILDALAALKNRTGRYDTTVVFLAGHGKTEGDRYYFLPIDADEDNFTSRGITGGEIKDLLRDVNGHVLLFVDTCYAGALTGSRAIEQTADITPLISELMASDAGLIVYAASQRGERSEELNDNGVFTRALLDVLTGKAGRDNDGAIHVHSLYADLYTEVTHLALPPGQHPSVGIPNGSGDPAVFIPQ